MKVRVERSRSRTRGRKPEDSGAKRQGTSRPSKEEVKKTAPKVVLTPLGSTAGRCGATSKRPAPKAAVPAAKKVVKKVKKAAQKAPAKPKVASKPKRLKGREDSGLASEEAAKKAPAKTKVSSKPKQLPKCEDSESSSSEEEAPKGTKPLSGKRASAKKELPNLFKEKVKLEPLPRDDAFVKWEKLALQGEDATSNAWRLKGYPGLAPKASREPKPSSSKVEASKEDDYSYSEDDDPPPDHGRGHPTAHHEVVSTVAVSVSRRRERRSWHAAMPPPEMWAGGLYGPYGHYPPPPAFYPPPAPWAYGGGWPGYPGPGWPAPHYGPHGPPPYPGAPLRGRGKGYRDRGQYTSSRFSSQTIGPAASPGKSEVKEESKQLLALPPVEAPPADPKQ